MIPLWFWMLAALLLGSMAASAVVCFLSARSARLHCIAAAQTASEVATWVAGDVDPDELLRRHLEALRHPGSDEPTAELEVVKERGKHRARAA